MSRPRPLSPHLSVWRFQLPAIMSISHRISGVILASGTILLAVWLLALASGPQMFALVQAVLATRSASWCCSVIQLCCSYHGCNGGAASGLGFGARPDHAGGLSQRRCGSGDRRFWLVLALWTAVLL